MESIAHNQFPIIIWKEGKKLLWNPIHKKSLKNRPEERVRLRIIEYLLQAGWSKHRITTEEAIADYASEKLRTDIICYSKGFEPRILVECKAENIALTDKTARQIGRYNHNVEAPYLLISNGRTDLWYHIDHSTETVQTLDTTPDLLTKPESDPATFDYWKERGFAGRQAKPVLRKWLEPILGQFKKEQISAIQYLQFKKSPTDLALNHYYHISNLDTQKIALTFLNTAFGGTRLIAILNEEGTNRAVAEVNLDLLFEGEQPNSSIYSAEGIQNFNIRQEAAGVFGDQNTTPDLDTISKRLQATFRNHLSG